MIRLASIRLYTSSETWKNHGLWRVGQLLIFLTFKVTDGILRGIPSWNIICDRMFLVLVWTAQAEFSVGCEFSNVSSLSLSNFTTTPCETPEVSEIKKSHAFGSTASLTLTSSYSAHYPPDCHIALGVWAKFCYSTAPIDSWIFCWRH